jgi:hydroxymethylglutaryl-CoA lyase
MASLVKLIECPRDAWQGLTGLIPADLKANYLKSLINAGFKHIDAVSFVSPKAVPQMADSEEVLKELDPPDDVEIIGIVVNEKGAERAIATQAVSTLGFPYSVSETFLRKNQNQSPEDALDELEKIQKKADSAGLDVVVYISMAFGNPYGDLWNADEVIEAISLMEVDNLKMISLADTVGMANPEQVGGLVGAVPRRQPTKFWPRTMQGVAASTLPWADSEVVLSRRTHWLVTSRRRRCSQRLAKGAWGCLN